MLWPSWDGQLFFGINGISSPFLTDLMRILTNVDNWIPFLLILIGTLLWMGRTRPNSVNTGGRFSRWINARNPRIVLLCLVVSTGLSDQICYHIKHSVERSRPCLDEDISARVNYRGDIHGNRSFPSAHSSNSAALATTMAIAYPPLAPIAVMLAFLVGFSRIYLGVHYPLDVFAGWCIGTLSALMVWLAFRKMLSRYGLIGFSNRFRIRQPVSVSLSDPPWRVVEAESLDGFSMKGYFLESGRDLVIMVHGLHGNMDSISEPGLIFGSMGFSVLLVPLRGHDEHQCPVTTGGPGEAYDVAGMIIYAGEVLGFPAHRTIIFGSSMGGAAAMKASGILQRPLAGLICHGTYRNFFESAYMKMGRLKTALLKLLLPASARRGLEAFRPEEYIENMENTRLVFINGALDSISSPESGRLLAGVTCGLSILLQNTGHPSWSSHRWSEIQIEAAFRLAVEYIRGKEMKPLTVDESGVFNNFPAS